MRPCTAITVSILALLFCSPATAGLYGSRESSQGPSVGDRGVQALSFQRFREVLNDLLQVGLAKPGNPRREQYESRVAELGARERQGRLSTAEKVDLSAGYIRLGRYEDAVRLLTPLALEERNNFVVFANLGTAHQLAGRLESAARYLEQAGDVWPSAWPGWSKEQLDWFGRAEKYHRKLVRLRYRESLLARRGQKPAGNPDELFGKVIFVGESGRYQAGAMKARERAKLPADAIALVQQLLLWMPGSAPGMEDTRLYWLLGELYNASGDTGTAGQILERCVWSHRYDAADLREHRRVIQESRPVVENTPLPLPATAPVPVDAAWIPSTRQLTIVGCVVGLVAAAFTYLQVREWLRRRKAST